LKHVVAILLAATLAGCSWVPKQVPSGLRSEPVVQVNPQESNLRELPPLDGPPMTIGVYSFTDKTGQRKPADNMASLSSAVTQGAEVWVIDALLEAGGGEWFEVVERTGMDNVIKERQLIRSTRENYEQGIDRNLAPMKFAGLILEGGIVGYDSNITTGGAGARYMNIGTSAEYRVDTVTVAMRIVSVSTGRVLMSVATQKTIASYRQSADAFQFLDMGTKALELEAGYSANEPTNYAVRAVIEAAVVELVYEGVRKGLWNFKKEN
jgi:curli production assembly/transport component CsgG